MTRRVRVIAATDIESVALALARSIERDPFYTWLYGQGALRRLIRSFRSQLRVQFVPRGLGYTVDDLTGAAIWSAPGRGVSPTFWESVRMIPAHPQFLPPARMVRALRAFSVMDSHHPHEPHAHLSLLGVDPSYQRSGTGTALLEDGLSRADAVGVPVYLDTANPDNVAYYARFGFEVTCEFTLPFGGPDYRGMLRRTSASTVRDALL